MNTNGLAKHYGNLSPFERLPLLTAAEARDDALEAGRLARSAPRGGWSIAADYGLSLGLERLAATYVMRQLAAAVEFRAGVALLDSLSSHAPRKLPPGGTNLPTLFDPRARAQRRAGRIDRAGAALRYLAFLIVTGADAWLLLCSQLGIDPDPPLRDLPGYDTLRAAEAEAKEWAFTAEGTQVFLEAREGERSPPTAEEEAGAMQDFLREQLAQWAPSR